jgi:hypothetical protein
LRVVGVELGADGKATEETLSNSCRNGDFPGVSQILSWIITGPNDKGEAATEVAVRSKPGRFEFFCAYVAQQRRGEEINQTSWAVIAGEAPVVAAP